MLRRGKLLTQSAKNLSHWVTSCHRWVTFRQCHPVVVSKDALSRRQRHSCSAVAKGPRGAVPTREN